MKRPDIFGYHDFRVFLRDWFEYLKSRDPGFSVRVLSDELQLSSGFLSMVLSGARNPSSELLAQMVPHLHLYRSEIIYLENLVRLGSATTREAKTQALERMSRFTSYQKKNPNEAELLGYSSRWYHAAIREMASLPGFKADPEWIREKLKVRIPLKNIRAALKLLIEAGYLVETSEGTVAAVKNTVRVEGPVFKAALVQVHKQMFNLATESIENTPPTSRNLLGYTFSLGPSDYEQVNEILNRALNEIIAVEQKSKEARDAVYQVELALFPLTKTGES
jgi:uncharacterized protein (TIGR02147 family)